MATNPMEVLKNTPNVFQFKEEKSWWQRGVSLVTGVVIVLVAHVLGTVLKKYIFKLGEEKLAPERGAGEVPVSGTEASAQNQQTKITFVILGHFVYYVILIIGLMAVFKIVGLETTGLLAIIGATGFAIGLALQGVLSDVAAGILVAIFRFTL
jgi:small-conductance mechanosensitive channel